MPTVDEQRQLQKENAEADERVWSIIHNVAPENEPPSLADNSSRLNVIDMCLVCDGAQWTIQIGSFASVTRWRIGLRQTGLSQVLRLAEYAD